MPGPLTQILLEREETPQDAPYWTEFNRGVGMRRSDIKLPDHQLDIEQALMRLSGAYPDAYKRSVISAGPLARMLGAYAFVHPFSPSTIFYDPESNANQRTLETTLAHELGHVKQLSRKSLIERFIDQFPGTNSREQEELKAEDDAVSYIRGLKGNIRLK